MKDCTHGQSIYKIRSEHHDYEEDRLWDIQCRPSNANGYCYWTDFLNQYDRMVAYQCPNNAVISGMYSEHQDYYEDRIFKVKSCVITEGTLSQCYNTQYINDWDGSFDYVVQQGEYLTGIQSEHDDYYEDRRFKLTLCALN